VALFVHAGDDAHAGKRRRGAAAGRWDLGAGRALGAGRSAQAGALPLLGRRAPQAVKHRICADQGER